MEQQQHMFTNRMIRNLLIPVVLEQLLNSIMGTADTMMVSNVGSAAISAVSLVDSINVLVIQAFSALAAGGAIVCAQYIGQRNKEKSKRICKTGVVYHNSYFDSSESDLSCFPETTSQADLWLGRSRGYESIRNLFLLHGSVISVYCRL